jgi:hypothetical protein
MESLFSILVDETESTISEALNRPYLSREWQGRTFELIVRRAQVFEDNLPVLAALAHRRYDSARARQHATWIQDLEHFTWLDILPTTIKADIAVFSGLEISTSAEAWLRLRNGLNLSPADSLETQRKLIARLLGPR